MISRIKLGRSRWPALWWSLIAVVSLWAAAVHVVWAQAGAAGAVGAAAAAAAKEPAKPPTPVAGAEAAASAPDVSVATPGPWLMEAGLPARSLRITTGNTEVKGLRIAQVQLFDASKQRSLDLAQLQLCEKASGGDCSAVLDTLKAKHTQTVFLRVKGDDAPIGRYTGTVDLAIDGRTDVKTVSLEVFATSKPMRVLGALAIAAGVFMAWWLTVASRQRLQRLNMLLPVAAAAERLAALRVRLNRAAQATGVVYPNLLRETDRWLDTELSEAQLTAKGFLPTVLSILPMAADAPTRLQTWLRDVVEPRVAGLTMLVQEGVEPLTTEWLALPPAGRADVEKGLQCLDSVADAASETLAAKRVGMAKDLAHPHAQTPRTAGAAQAGFSAAPLTVQRLITQIEALNLTNWWGYLALTTLAGIAALIINNAAFGTPMDFVLCLFWGFGLPVTVDKLLQLTPAGVATPLGISLPKT